MGNPNQQIYVVNRKHLFKNGIFQGFRDIEIEDYEAIILKNLEVMRRGSTIEPENHPLGNAELSNDYKQPIGYAIVANISNKKVFAYKRAIKDQDYNEKRLQGKWSWGFGGHIEYSDTTTENPIRTSMIREVTLEELEIPGKIKSINTIGYINDETDSVGKVHFGILYLIDTDAEMVNPKGNEGQIVESKNIIGLEELCNSIDCKVENWSKISLDLLRKIL